MPVAWTSIDFALLAMKDNQLHGTLPPLSEESWSEMSWLDLAGNGFSGMTLFSSCLHPLQLCICS